MSARRRSLLALAPVIAALGASATPVFARDTYFLSGPVEIRMIGANGQARDFLAISPRDRQGASALIDQLTTAAPPVGPPLEALTGLPHYRLGVGRLGLGDARVWPRLPETTFSYYVGGSTTGFLVLDGGQPTVTAPRTLALPAAVTTMIDSHLQGLPPLEAQPATGVSTAPWEIMVGALLLTALVVVVFEDRRRWGQTKRRSAGSKGT